MIRGAKKNRHSTKFNHENNDMNPEIPSGSIIAITKQYHATRITAKGSSGQITGKLYGKYRPAKFTFKTLSYLFRYYVCKIFVLSIVFKISSPYLPSIATVLIHLYLFFATLQLTPGFRNFQLTCESTIQF